mmetsp:Transcript_3851/g.10105  ORF Transcript_3851/g.10105 Transcript_3851/m.10105 type:complete len:669 (+) Transcript_3851:67-2073(+)|eukprot:CAMPEP_0197199208 /NCGR_PEP_ID=MMETSP1423-20130617/33770_1 /TAXON_ID=476441 /ORGANISM="Pseudo-nitzschia heimii, Strain UNC1101" /LENGTH=668 /DNA_ID=CAMNT_0042653063 /DNA_START=52 /DNA_END=2058 /DNA_ORIENTATION=-
MVPGAKTSLNLNDACHDTNSLHDDGGDDDKTNWTDNSWQDRSQVVVPPSWFVIQLTLTASLGGCLFGYDMGAISGTLPQLTNTFDLDDHQKELSVSILYVGGAIGACIGGNLCDLIGRKVTIMLTDVVFILGALILYFASVYTEVVIGRFVVGIGVAVSGVADVSYLHECSPIEWRGAIVSVNEACISLGFLLAYIAGYVFANEGAEEWRVVFGVAGILAAIQFIGMLALPESPAWLTEIGDFEAAKRVMERINNTSYSSSMNVARSEGESALGSDSISSEPRVPTIRQRCRRSDKLQSNVMAGSGIERSNSQTLLRGDDSGPEETNVSTFEIRNISGCRENHDSPKEDCTSYVRFPNNSAFSFICSRYNDLGHKLQTMKLNLLRLRRQIYIAIFLAVTQQFCGQTNILSYAPLIFAEAMKRDFEVDKSTDDDNNNAGRSEDMSMIIIGLVKFFVTVLVIWRIEYIGRRFLLIFGNILIAMGLLALVIAFGGSSTSVDVDDNTADAATSWSPLTNINTFHLALPGVLLVVCGYSMSFGPLTWLLTSEIFPTDIRGRALGYSTIVSYICGAISTETFLFSQSILGPSFVFGVYCVVTVAGILFVYMAIPDTGGKSVEKINDSLQEMYWWKYGAIALSQNEEQFNHCEPNSSNRSGMVQIPSQLSMHDLT